MSPGVRSIIPVLAAIAVLGVGVAAGVGTAAPERSAVRVDLAGIREHLQAFQRIADRNGGNRFAGTAGYDASAAYVADRMRKAGYVVRVQRFEFPFVFDRSAPQLRVTGGASFRAGRDVATLQYSGSGRAQAQVVAVDLLIPSPQPNASTSGCEPADFAAFPKDAIALLQRGTCTFRQKVVNATAAGASAVVVFNEGNEGRQGLFAATLGPPQVRIPALAASLEVGNALRKGATDGATGVEAMVEADVAAEQRRTSNLIAESRAGSASKVVMAGAHLDSVEDGPGINDNGSGSAVILEIAEQLADTRPKNKLRFAWWGAEELGLIGSRRYVSGLSRTERSRIALYLNLDMVGSRNFARFVYDGDGSSSRRGARRPPAGSAAIERVFAQYFDARKLAYRETGMGGSDHLPFAQAGIPVGGLFSGASGRKSTSQQTAFGGTAGRPYDACYHRACDTLKNVSGPALTQMARAAAHAIELFARDVSSVTRSR